ncbi:MAG: GNAT family N-acetyltransferase [Gemmatimonadota bacterium]|nr:GNAT family N-acetyltransferase [Gemmatimonadota bacterium]
MTGHVVAVRRATPADVDSIAPLFDAYRQFYENAPDLAGARVFLRDRLERGESVVLVAEAGNGVAVGFTQLYPSFSSNSLAAIWVLNDLFVDPAARRTGAGRALLRAAADHARATGAVRLTLMTAHANATAQALYESEGWVLDREFRTYTLAV